MKILEIQKNGILKVLVKSMMKNVKVYFELADILRLRLKCTFNVMSPFT